MTTASSEVSLAGKKKLVKKPINGLVAETVTDQLAALATETRRVRLGHIVLCAAYRNAALTVKMISTLDVISGGRMELGIGAGWKRDEWQAYGYGFPPAPERLALRAQLDRALDEGMAALPDIARARRDTGWSEAEVQAYLRGFNYRLGASEDKAIAEFIRLRAFVTERGQC